MKLARILEHLIPRKVMGPLDRDVDGLFYDSRKVEKNAAFFAIRGEAVDGHDFIEGALGRGASVIFMEEQKALPEGVSGVVVDDTRHALAVAAAAFYGDATTDCPVVGVTGTNGKTTTTYLVESLMRAAGKSPAVFGTVSYRFDRQSCPASHTTPESVDLLKLFAEFRAMGANGLVLEVSSHALDQRRVESLRFDVGIFTNLTPEHLDYHHDMESYFASKKRFFTEILPKSGGRAVVNIDDPYGRRLADSLVDPVTYGTDPAAAIRLKDLRMTFDGITGVIETWDGPFDLHSPLLGRFNAENLLASIAAGKALGYANETIRAGLASAAAVPGRMERIENDRGALILVDYAHTSDALEKALIAGRELNPRRVITLFGCGGDRDRTKRPAMGRIASSLSDLVIVTSDNPRTEDPLAIIDEITPGVRSEITQESSPEELSSREGKAYCVIPDRRAAIERAVASLRAGDLLLVAGKGHEDYQVIGKDRIHFDDREELRLALAGRGEKK